MLVRIVFVYMAAHLLIAEVVFPNTTLNSEINWMVYSFKHDIGFDRLERAIARYNRR